MADEKNTVKDTGNLMLGIAIIAGAYAIGKIKGRSDGIKEVSNVAETISEVSEFMASKEDKDK